MPGITIDPQATNSIGISSPTSKVKTIILFVYTYRCTAAGRAKRRKGQGDGGVASQIQGPE